MKLKLGRRFSHPRMRLVLLPCTILGTFACGSSSSNQPEEPEQTAEEGLPSSGGMGGASNSQGSQQNQPDPTETTNAEDDCASGFYGEECLPVTTLCVHGVANDGRAGDGNCSCGPGWQGASCEQLVAVRDYSVSEDIFCVVSNQGKLLCRGDDKDGTLGNPEIDSPTATLTHILSSENVYRVAAGRDSVCAVTENGQAYCWGENDSGQLGAGYLSEEEQEPVLVVGGPAAGWRDIFSGDATTCGLGRDDSLWCWGNNSAGEVGVETSEEDFPSGHVTTPQEVAPGTSWLDVEVHYDATCGIQTDGSLWCWGEDDDGQIGLLEENGNVYEPVQVGTEKDWVDFQSGSEQEGGCATKRDRSLWCWGENADGSLGLGTFIDDIWGPTLVENALWLAFDLDEDLSCGVQMDGSLWCAGENRFGQLAKGFASTARADSSATYTQIGSENDWVNVEVETDCIFALKENGELYVWGEGYKPSLGFTLDPPVHTTALPSQVVGGLRAESLSSAFNEDLACASGDEKEAYCWGN
ncbi:MAG: hypothetical protein MK135_10985, partial [Polyangiaceae bacterium]|nr:hypothetical protein [Polyangiaceae bacterium]